MVALQVYRLPLLSTPTMSSMGVITCATGAGVGATTTGTVAAASTGGALFGLINIAQAASPIAAMATINKPTRTSKSLR